MPEDEKIPAPGLVVPWTWLAGGLAILSIGLLGSLAVVAAEREADTLSTIALALAVIAFSAQLIVSLAQGMSGAQQIAQVERVNADTQSALSALRATSDALLTTQREQFGEVLRAALARAVPEAVNETLTETDAEDDSPRAHELEAAIFARVNELLADRGSTAVSALPRFSKDYKILTTYPDETRGRELAQILKSLTPWEAQYFRAFVEEVKRRLLNGGSTGFLSTRSPRGEGPANRGLREKGLLIREERGQASVWLDLTDLGKEVASLVLGNGRLPDWLLEEVSS